MTDPRESGSRSGFKRRRITPRTDEERTPIDADNEPSPTPAQGTEQVHPPTDSNSDQSDTQSPDADGFTTLIVGPNRHKFSIPSDILISISHYFKSALTGGFREDHNQTIIWRDESPALTERFQRWVYSYSILASSETVEGIDWDLLLDMYNFAEAYDIPGLRNTVLDVFIDRGEETNDFPCSLLRKVYETTPRNCLLRKFLLDTASAGRLRAWFTTEEKRALYPREFLFDLIILETDGRIPNRDFRDVRADYHHRNDFVDRVRVRRRTSPVVYADPPNGPERTAEDGEVEQDE